MHIHARTFETKWGQGLAFLDNDDDYATEVLKLRVWGPVAEDGGIGCVEIKIGLKGEPSERAMDTLEEANRTALKIMDADRFVAALDKAGVGALLDGVFAARDTQGDA